MKPASGQYPLPLPHGNAMGADDFMTADSNRAAVQFCDLWPNWPAHCAVVYGPEGSGKTHLLHIWQQRAQARNVTLDDLLANSATELCAANRNLALDNADKISRNAKAEEALFHLYNQVKETGGSLLLAAATAPAHWNMNLPDLRSRLCSVPAIAIAAPDDDLLSALLIKQFRDRQIDIGMEVVNYILPRIPRTFAALRALVTALDKTSLAEGRGISIALAKKLIEDENFILSP